MAYEEGAKKNVAEENYKYVLVLLENRINDSTYKAKENTIMKLLQKLFGLNEINVGIFRIGYKGKRWYL